MVSKASLWFVAAGGLSLAAFGQTAPSIAPVPSDPLELVTGQIQTVDSGEGQEAAMQLLDRARNSYALRSAGVGYDLKVTFSVNSGGLTKYDGPWEMEDVFDPKQGLRWTARAGVAFTATQISLHGVSYGESSIPLRLHEARAALFGPIPASANVARDVIRTSTASFNGAQVTCILLSGVKAAPTSPGRRWEETEECIDPQSGLLQVHSQVPGRYYAYEYSNAPQLAGHVLPRKVIVTEAGKTVSEISVESLRELPAADPSLFAPSEEMKARGRAVAMSGAQKISRAAARVPFTSAATIRPVCVFGLMTSSGQLVEAHSLQPSDPNSQAAVEAAKQMTFSTPTGAPPEQHFVFILEKFVSNEK